MRKMASILSAVALSVGLCAATSGVAEAGPENYHGDVPIAVWERLADCESGRRWYINTGNGYYGGVQISERTWDGYGGKRYARYPHRAGKYLQMNIADQIQKGQGWNAWPTCSHEAGIR